jgi:hypothetical protein
MKMGACARAGFRISNVADLGAHHGQSIPEAYSSRSVPDPETSPSIAATHLAKPRQQHDGLELWIRPVEKDGLSLLRTHLWTP